MLEEFAGAGVQCFHLHTDSDCDMGFYDHQRMTRVAQRNISDADDADLVLFAPEISCIYAGETEQILGHAQQTGRTETDRTETDHTETSRISRASRAAQLDITEQPNHTAAARKDGAR
jgi:hypothetical protein